MGEAMLVSVVAGVLLVAWIVWCTDIWRPRG